MAPQVGFRTALQPRQLPGTAGPACHCAPPSQERVRELPRAVVGSEEIRPRPHLLEFTHLQEHWWIPNPEVSLVPPKTPQCTPELLTKETCHLLHTLFIAQDTIFHASDHSPNFLHSLVFLTHEMALCLHLWPLIHLITENSLNCTPTHT